MVRFFILLLCLPLNLLAQVNESFSDNNFTTAPEWSGQVDKFIVNSDQELQLNDTEAGTSYLSTACNVVEEASWSFRIRMDFNPSSSNLARIYLISDNSLLSEANNAIYVELGSTDDNICLYNVKNGSKTKAIEGAADRLDIASVDAMIKITRLGNEWTLESDLGTGWQTEGIATSEFNSPSASFGVYCQYTKTRADKFYFDDIQVSGQPYKDKTPPVVTDFHLINGSTMQLFFSEALDASSITTNDFLLKSSERQPSSFSYDATNRTITLVFDPIIDNADEEQLVVSNICDMDGNSLATVELTFSYQRPQLTHAQLLNTRTLQLSFSKPIPSENLLNSTLLADDVPLSIASVETDDDLNFTVTITNSLNEGQTYRLNMSNVIDAIGDLVPSSVTTVMFYHGKRFDIVFNEWMADPTPSMGLPEVEYIELFNPSAYDISLNNWVLMINDKEVALPDSSIAAGKFICLLASSDFDSWPETIPGVFIKSLPALTNAGCDLVLLNAHNQVIDAFRYNPSNIEGEGFKKEGGWSAERLDPLNLSGEANNYQWSMDLKGGTPGAPNSVYQQNADEQAPSITHLALHEQQTLQITFSECMQLSGQVPIDISPMPEIAEQTYDTVFLNQLHIRFTHPLAINQVYQLNGIDISDLAGHPLTLEHPISFGVADSLEPGDVLINEVLFNPQPEGADFVEIYNRSDKIIDLADVFYAVINETQIEKLYQASGQHQLLLPQSYAAFTTDAENIKQNYQCKNKANIFETSPLPSYPDDEGHVVIANKYGNVLDEFNYNESMHFDLLKDKEGVSLERLSWQRPTNEAGNWYSAASSAGFATPGYLNSQQTDTLIVTETIVSVQPEVFTPNGDGIDDRLYIHFNIDEPGATATIRIYNSNGTEVRYLVNNQTLADNGYFIWDGLSENNSILQPGIYIIYFQCIYPTGQIIEEKVTCIISAQSNF